jgi:hypothetical protein
MERSMKLVQHRGAGKLVGELKAQLIRVTLLMIER